MSRSRQVPRRIATDLPRAHKCSSAEDRRCWLRSSRLSMCLRLDAQAPASAGPIWSGPNCHRSDFHGRSPYRNCLIVDKSGLR